MAELDEGLGRLDRLLDGPRVRADDSPRCCPVPTSFTGLSANRFLTSLPLFAVQARLDAVGVGRAQLDAQHVGLRAVGDQRRQVPVGAPLVGDHAKGHVTAPLAVGRQDVPRIDRQRRSAQPHGLLQETTA